MKITKMKIPFWFAVMLACFLALAEKPIFGQPKIENGLFLDVLPGGGTMGLHVRLDKIEK